MAETKLQGTTTTSSTIQDYTVTPRTTDGINQAGETIWSNPDFAKWFGYYKSIPELKKPVDALATYTIGNGYTCLLTSDEVALEHVIGSGEDTFESIMWNMLVIKKVNGDAYAEIIRDNDGNLINLKPLSPADVTIIYDDKGLIKEYEHTKKNVTNKIKIQDMFHIMNDRVADETHGTSVVEVCQWVIDTRNELMADKRRMHHRSTIRIMEVDSDNSTQISNLKTQYAEAIKNGEVLIVPKGQIGFPEAPIAYIDTMEFIRYLEGFFYQALGVPKVILGGTEGIIEASSKVSLFAFDQVWKYEQRQLEKDIWNQLAIRLKFYSPSSLKDEMVSSDAANTGQVGFQPNATTIGSGQA